MTVHARHLYRVSHLLIDLVWVDFDLGAPPSCPSAQPLLPNSHQPRHNLADSGTLKIKVNPTQFSSRCNTLYTSRLSGGNNIFKDVNNSLARTTATFDLMTILKCIICNPSQMESMQRIFIHYRPYDFARGNSSRKYPI